MEEIKIFVQNTITGKIIQIKIKKNIDYKNLLNLIQKEFDIKIEDYKILFDEKEITQNLIANLKNNDTLQLTFDLELEEEAELNLSDIDDIDESNIVKERYINTAFIENDKDDDKNKKEDSDDEIMERKSLSGILNICLLKYISRDIDDDILNKLKSPMKEIIETIKKEINFKNHSEEDIKAILKDKSGDNIFEYCKYINKLLTKKSVDDLIALFDDTKKEKFNNFWSKLMKYEEFNSFFEKELEIALRNSYFDYSVISMILYEKSRRKRYLKERKKCPNCCKRFLFHGTQIDPISNIVTSEFWYTRKAFYGMGIYFSDMLDYIGFYAGGEDYETRRRNFGKILPIGQTFSCIGTEIYYDKTKLKRIYDWSLHVDELDHFPTYEELKKRWPTKMVQKNGIHLAKVEPNGGQVVEEINIPKEEKKGTFLGNEYIITEMDQIFPLYGLTLKRNEYFVVWRDNHFAGKNCFSEYLANRKLFLNKFAKMNVYFESNNESALRLISKKKYNKIILISNIGLDRAGKKFIEIARKILGFDAVVLFFSGNKIHFEWLKNFKNALYTDTSDFYEEYVMNYNETGLKNLKNKVEKNYKIKFPEFTDDFLSFPKFIKENKTYLETNFSETCENFRHVKIYHKYSGYYINMNNDGALSLDSKGQCIWDITLDKGEITLYANNHYLGIKNGNPYGNEFMEIGTFKKYDNNCYSINFENMYLSVEGFLFFYSIKFLKSDTGEKGKFIFIDTV